MLIISLSGPSGSGKSSIIKGLATQYDVLNEKYMDLNIHKIDNRYILSKWKWIGYWFESVFNFASNGCRLLITDRSPIDTAAYAENGSNILLPAILQSIYELRHYGHKLVSVLITAELDELIRRTKSRMQHEPERGFYHEIEMEFSKKVYSFFVGQKNLWYATLNTTSNDRNQTMEQLKIIISELSNQKGQ